MDLKGTISLITGGGRGLGQAFAIALAKAGATVIITARSEPQLHETVYAIEQFGGSALAIPADVTNSVAARHVVATIEQRYGTVNLLVNNAGTFCAFGLIAEIDAEEWWREVEINLRGPFLYSQTALPAMIRRRQGRIINIASAAGLGAVEAMSAYNVSKAALIRLTESLAIEARDYGIAVFALHPGTVRTPMNDYVIQSDMVEQRAPRVAQWMRKHFASNQDTPVERAIAMVMSLASGYADALSGCYISVEDDLESLVQQAKEIQRDGRQKLRLRT